MKSKRILFAILLSALVFSASRPLYAAGYGMSIGMNTWFAWWKPFFLESPNSSKTNQTYTMKPAFFYGPSIAFHFPKHISISSTFFYSNFEGKESYTSMMIGPPSGIFLIPSSSSIKVTRYDSDSALIIGVASFLQLTMGFKYAHYNFNIHEVYSLNFLDKHKIYDEYSPAIGLNFIIPLIKRQFYLTIGGSAIFSWCTVDQYGKNVLVAPIPSFMVVLPLEKQIGKFYKIGTNLTTGFAYYVEQAKMTFSLGFRYQMYNLLKNDPTIGKQDLSKSFDHFYGITAGAILRVDFTGDKKNDQEAPEQSPDA